MRSFAEKKRPAQEAKSSGALLQLPQAHVQQLEDESSTNAPRSSAHDFSRIPVHAVARPTIQPKLKVDATKDTLEQEADHIAEQVMSDPLLQPRRACACGGRCPKRQTEQHVQGQKRLQTKRAETSDLETVAPSIAYEAASTSGQPLDATTRARMEARFARDFSLVRTHTDGEAATAARAIGARAYTIGHDIVFGEAEYWPGSVSGQRLLAHELAHVVQQRESAQRIQRAPDQKKGPAEPDLEQIVAKKEAEALEKEILAHPVYKGLKDDSKANVWWIIAKAKARPLGDARGQRNYYLNKLKLVFETPFEGKEGGCTEANEKENREEVEAALGLEELSRDDLGDVEEFAVSTGTRKVPRVGMAGRIFYVDRSDPRFIRVQIKVMLVGEEKDVESIKKLEDAIEEYSATKGYVLDIVFVDKPGPDVFVFSTTFCQWANAGNWAAGPKTLSHEVHHALGLPDRYDFIERHAGNKQIDVPGRLFWFARQMDQVSGPRDPFSKMGINTGKPLLSEDVCAVAFPVGIEREKCVEERKGLDPEGTPPP